MFLVKPCPRKTQHPDMTAMLTPEHSHPLAATVDVQACLPV